MTRGSAWLLTASLALTGASPAPSAHARPLAPAPAPAAALLDAAVRAGMASTGAKGIAVAVIDHGKVVLVRSWGLRNAKGDPLTRDTVMYGASITKAVFAYTVMQLAAEQRIDLDASIATYLRKPLPDYGLVDGRYPDWSPLRGDERWRKLTPRMLLEHASGFANFGFLEPDHKLRFHFDPGARYGYSGDGILLLQFVLEQGLGLDLGAEMQRRVFDRFGMRRTGMTWRLDFASDFADGWDSDGTAQPHDERSRVRAAGSMDTTINDLAAFVAGFMRGDGLPARARAEMIRPGLPITTTSQFPTLQPELPPEKRFAGLAAGLGVVTFTGPQGAGFYKGGHDDITGNSWVCLERGRRCVVILANDVRAEAMFPTLVRSVLGETGTPWRWEYGDQPWTRP